AGVGHRRPEPRRRLARFDQWPTARQQLASASIVLIRAPPHPSTATRSSRLSPPLAPLRPAHPRMSPYRPSRSSAIWRPSRPAATPARSSRSQEPWSRERARTNIVKRSAGLFLPVQLLAVYGMLSYRYPDATSSTPSRSASPSPPRAM